MSISATCERNLRRGSFDMQSTPQVGWWQTLTARHASVHTCVSRSRVPTRSADCVTEHRTPADVAQPCATQLPQMMCNHVPPSVVA
eukprot:12379602-Alexandrium_andersonii.AAC.1